MRVEVVFKGRVDPEWEQWFEGLDLTPGAENTTTLVGELPDATALYGILAKLRDLGLSLVSVQSSESKGDLS